MSRAGTIKGHLNVAAVTHGFVVGDKRCQLCPVASYTKGPVKLSKASEEMIQDDKVGATSKEWFSPGDGYLRQSFIALIELTDSGFTSLYGREPKSQPAVVIRKPQLSAFVF